MRFRIAAVMAAAFIWGSASAGEAVAAPQGAAAAPKGPAAAPRGTAAAAAEAHAVSDLSSQRRRRASTRITIYPRRVLPPTVVRSGPRIDVNPRPNPYEWPGPGATRECVGWLAPEARPSGTVIVPHRRCVWRQG
jgi:hypothetical protein